MRMIHRLTSKLKYVCTQLPELHCHRKTQLTEACHMLSDNLGYTASMFRNKVTEGLHQLEMQSSYCRTSSALH
jgi:hypothetical protein